MDTEVVITPHPLNVETEMTLVEFTELLTRVALIKTKSLKKKLRCVFHAFFMRFSCVFHAFFTRFPTKHDDFMQPGRACGGVHARVLPRVQSEHAGCR